MGEVIKRLGQKIQDENAEDEIDHLIEQVPHKENVLVKDSGKTVTLTISGTVLTFVNGQLTASE